MNIDQQCDIRESTIFSILSFLFGDSRFSTRFHVYKIFGIRKESIILKQKKNIDQQRDIGGTTFRY